MFTVKRRLGGFAATWNDGTEFIDPDPFRAIELAANDEIRRLYRASENARRAVRAVRVKNGAPHNWNEVKGFADEADQDDYLASAGVPCG